jgi:S-adenosylmethionine synthetase
LDLLKPIYRKLAAYGHMGREDLKVKWEDTPRITDLLRAVSEATGKPQVHTTKAGVTAH